MRHFLFVVAGLFAFTLAAQADTVYSFTSYNYSYVHNSANTSTPYTTSERVEGYLYFHLEPDVNPQAPDDVIVTKFSFNDGAQTLDTSNATADFYFDTNAPGAKAFYSTNPAAIGFFSIDIVGKSNPGLAYIYVLYSATHTQTVAEQDNGNFAEAPGYGTLTLAPEPSSLLLLGTGVLGAAGILRRRFV